MKYNPVTDDYEPEGPWDEAPRCPVCGDDMERELCDRCDGTGEVDCYEDDAINYAPGQEYEPCGQCGGEGGWWLCPQRGDDRHGKQTLAAVAGPPDEPTSVPAAYQCRLCRHVFADGEDYDGHVTRRGETTYTCRDTSACLERRTTALVMRRQPPASMKITWPWFITVRLRADWTMNATVEATCEADAINQEEAVVRELLRVDVARDQISAIDVPF